MEELVKAIVAVLVKTEFGRSKLAGEITQAYADVLAVMDMQAQGSLTADQTDELVNRITENLAAMIPD